MLVVTTQKRLLPTRTTWLKKIKPRSYLNIPFHYNKSDKLQTSHNDRAYIFSDFSEVITDYTHNSQKYIEWCHDFRTDDRIDMIHLSD